MSIKQFNDLPVLTEVNDKNNYIIERDNNLLQINKAVLQNYVTPPSNNLPIYYILSDDDTASGYYWKNLQDLQQDLNNINTQNYTPLGKRFSELVQKFIQGEKFRVIICDYDSNYNVTFQYSGIPLLGALNDDAKHFIVSIKFDEDPDEYTYIFELPAAIFGIGYINNLYSKELRIRRMMTDVQKQQE